MSELPGGAVTFLFTDIEGSTRLVKELREQWGAVLADHGRLLRDAFAQHHGHEVDTQGDSFFVAFPSARDAILAAVGAQRVLAEHEWPNGAEVRVRMGIHTGQAAVAEERYLGLSVHRAARIGAAAHGGQVLASQTTVNLLEDEEQELPEIRLRDLGPQPLKDLDRPVRLYQVEAPGLRRDFPKVRTAERDRRRWWLLGAAAAATASIAIVAALLATGGGGTQAVAPNSVGAIDPRENAVVAQVPVGTRPAAVTYGGGSVWVANTADQTISKLNPSTNKVERAIPLGGTPTGLATGDGAVWAAEGLTGDVSRIDPSFFTVKTIRATHAFNGGGLGGSIAVAPGEIWAAWGNSDVTRISPRLKLLGTLLAGRSPGAIAYGERSFWVVNSGDNTVLQYSLATGRQVGAPIHVGAGAAGAAVGDGSVWVAGSTDGTLTRYNTRSGSQTERDVGTGPQGVAYGDGAAWVANSGDGTVARVDAKTLDVRTIKVGGSPVGVAYGGGRVWVTVQAR
jgi:YVTN family beta-propeller protein